MRPPARTAALGATSLLAALLCLAGLLLGPTGSADAAVHAQRVGVAPALPHGAHLTGRLAARTTLSVDITLAPAHPAALSTFDQAVTDPASADYHRYLSVREFRRRFAPSAADVAEVRRGLRDAGLAPGAVSANGLLIRVSAPAAQLAHAFHTGLERVRLSSGRLAYANTEAPQFSADLTGLVQGVVGLNDLSTPHAEGILWASRHAGHHGVIHRADASAHSTGANAVAPCASASTAAGDYDAYTADEIAATYGFDSLYAGGDEGAGQTVALMEFEPYLSSDIATYNACYGINGASSSDVSEVNVDGGVGSADAGEPDGQGEAVLDIEQVLGLAPAAKVDVYEAPNSDQGSLDADTAMVQNPSVKVISTSWGECERLGGSELAEAENTIFEEAAAQGQSVYAAAGDSGSTDCSASRSASSLSVDDPGSQPYVTSVGGTTLTDGDVATQTAWNDSSSRMGAGGGGVSLQWAMPSYQSNASSALGLVNADSSSSPCAANVSTTTDCREVPDVSADADPQTGYVVYFSGDDANWAAIGGTSAAAPLWAAMTALANASTYCGSTSIGFANPVIYGVADNPSAYASDFTDVSSGDTDYTPAGYAGGLFPATSGYDMATGLGTPNAASLVPAMCVAAGGPGTAPTTVFTGVSSSAGPSASSSTSTGTGTGTAGSSSSSSGSDSGNSDTGSAASSSATTTTITTTTTTASDAPPTIISVSSAGTKRTTGSGRAAPSGSGAISTGTTTPAGCRLITLGAGAVTMALSRRHARAQMRLALTLPAGCRGDLLDFQRRVTTSERHDARALDTLKVQVLARSGRVLATLTTLSNRDAARGYVAVQLNLARYAGEKLTLRFLATRTGARATAFTLRSVALNLN